MGLHHRDSHGRVFHGSAAREQLAARKRDSHGNQPIMHVPEGFTEDSTSDDPGAVQVVYVTLSQTFSGAAVYSTLTGEPSVASTAIAAASTTASVLKGSAVAASRSSASGAAVSTSVATVSPAQSTTLGTSYAPASSGTNTQAASTVAGIPIQATASSNSNSNALSQDSTGNPNNGMSSGGKAGLAIGIILIFGLIAALVFFFLRKRKRPTNDDAFNEKNNRFSIGSAAATGAFPARQMAHGEREASKRDSSQTDRVPASVRSTRTASTAPRLSLRPITQLMTNFGENRKSGGNALDVAAAGGLAASDANKSAWERRPVNSTNANPFEDSTSRDARRNSGLTDPFDEKRSVDAPSAASAVTQQRYSPEPQTPTNVDAAAIAAVTPGSATSAGSAPPRGPNNVHRVQLDFKPSMDDELELRSGQLVRMLHEYDDGWALCIRMDRSQQGVAPRTCLSKLPVKPRPQGAPSSAGSGSRPGTAQSNRSGPTAPGMMVPRPLTPTSAGRSPSPQETRDNANAETAGPARVQRKPVPGIAM